MLLTCTTPTPVVADSSNWFIFAATVAYVVVSILMWDAMRRNNKITLSMAEAMYRPFVESFISHAAEIDEGGKRIKFPFSIHNTSTIPCKKVSIEWEGWANNSPVEILSGGSIWPVPLSPNATKRLWLVTSDETLRTVEESAEQLLLIKLHVIYQSTDEYKYVNHATYLWRPGMSMLPEIDPKNPPWEERIKL